MAGHSQEEQEQGAVSGLLLRKTFDLFCAENEIPSTRRTEVPIMLFIDWAQNNVTPERVSYLCEQAEASFAQYERFRATVIDSPRAAQQLAPSWMALCLSHQPAPKHRVRQITQTLVFSWEDGTANVAHVVLTPDMVGMGVNVITDGAALATLGGMISQQLRSILVDEGLDLFHDDGANFSAKLGGTEPREVLIGLLLKGLPQLAPEFREPVNSWVRCVQTALGLLTPEQIEKIKQAASAPPNGLPSW